MAKEKFDNQREVTSVELANKIVILTIEPFDLDVDMDDLCKIHHHNLYGEIITISVALNRIGNLLANVSEILAKTKLDFEIFYSQWWEKKQKELVVEIPDGKTGTKLSKPTKDDIDQSIIRSPEYKVKKSNLIKIQKNWDIVNSFYWALKDKSDKLHKLSDKLRPEEFEKELMEEKINGVLIQIANKAIK